MSNKKPTPQWKDGDKFTYYEQESNFNVGLECIWTVCLIQQVILSNKKKTPIGFTIFILTHKNPQRLKLYLQAHIRYTQTYIWLNVL